MTTKWWKEERGERIFVDYNQNARDRTIDDVAHSLQPLLDLYAADEAGDCPTRPSPPALHDPEQGRLGEQLPRAADRLDPLAPVLLGREVVEAQRGLTRIGGLIFTVPRASEYIGPI